MSEKEVLDLVELFSSSMTGDAITESLFERGYTKDQIRFINLGIKIGVRL